MPYRRLTRVWQLATAIALGLLLSIGLVAASGVLAARNAATLANVIRTERARAALTQTYAALLSAETGQRGYLLTRNEEYLSPYTQAVATLPGVLDRLQESLRDGPAAAALPKVAALRRLAADKLEELAQTLAQARAGDMDGALDVVQSNRGQRDMVALAGIVDAMGADQQRVLEDEIAAVNAGGRMLVLADTLGFVLLALLALGLGWSARVALRSMRAGQAALAEAYHALRRANDTLEERVAARTAALTEANDEMQRFAYIVSHDLRAPLVNIMGFTTEMEGAADVVRRFALQAAARDPEGTTDLVMAAEEDIPESLRFIKTSAAKMDRLIAAILRLSREGRRVLAADPVPMRPMLAGIVATLQHEADEHAARFVLGHLPDPRSDRLVLEQVFSNLLENAIKYRQPGRPGLIEVSGRAEPGWLHYEVKDNGRGIAPRDLERVFDLFRRAGDQTVPGEGIGLAHVRALVRRLGGRIDCVSDEGVGSTFRVALPRHEEASVDQGPEA